MLAVPAIPADSVSPVSTPALLGQAVRGAVWGSAGGRENQRAVAVGAVDGDDLAVLESDGLAGVADGEGAGGVGRERYAIDHDAAVFTVRVLAVRAVASDGEQPGSRRATAKVRRAWGAV